MKIVPNFPNYVIYRDGRIYSKNSNKFLKWCKNSRGYMVVTLIANGKRHTKNKSRLLAQCYLPNFMPSCVVRHLNDISTDDRIENLCCGTQSENRKDAYRNGKQSKKGEAHHNAKLTDSAVRYIRKNYIPYKNSRKLAEKFSVSVTTVIDAATKKLWKHI